MTFVVEADEALDPMDVCLSTAIRVVFAAQGLADPVQKFRWT